MHTTNFITLDEIRGQIDQLDHQLIDILADRQKLVAQAGLHKTSKEDVFAKERVDSLLKDRQEYSKEQQLSPQLTDLVFKAIIDFGQQQQLQKLK